MSSKAVYCVFSYTITGCFKGFLSVTQIYDSIVVQSCTVDLKKVTSAEEKGGVELSGSPYPLKPAIKTGLRRELHNHNPVASSSRHVTDVCLRLQENTVTCEKGYNVSPT